MFDKYADEAIEAEIWLKGREQGRDNRNVEMALDMLADDEPVEKIVKYSRLEPVPHLLRDAGNGFLSFLLIVRNSVLSVARKGEICISSFPRRRESSVAEYVYMKKMRPHMGSHFDNLILGTGYFLSDLTSVHLALLPMLRMRRKPPDVANSE